MKREEVEEVIENLSELGLEVVMTAPMLTKKALRFAYDRHITVYDALYLALAQDLEFEFITADGKLYEKVNNFWFVKYLKNIS
ncbi:MAG: type II toxin-antitoxin system VapC family toxin [bacterium]